MMFSPLTAFNPRCQAQHEPSSTPTSSTGSAELEHFSPRPITCEQQMEIISSGLQTDGRVVIRMRKRKIAIHDGVELRRLDRHRQQLTGPPKPVQPVKRQKLPTVETNDDESEDINEKTLPLLHEELLRRKKFLKNKVDDVGLVHGYRVVRFVNCTTSNMQVQIQSADDSNIVHVYCLKNGRLNARARFYCTSCDDSLLERAFITIKSSKDDEGSFYIYEFGKHGDNCGVPLESDVTCDKVWVYENRLFVKVRKSDVAKLTEDRNGLSMNVFGDRLEFQIDDNPISSDRYFSTCDCSVPAVITSHNVWVNWGHFEGCPIWAAMQNAGNDLVNNNDSSISSPLALQSEQDDPLEASPPRVEVIPAEEVPSEEEEEHIPSDAVEEVIQPIECTEPTKTPEPVPAALPATTRDSLDSMHSTSSKDSGILISDDSSGEMIEEHIPFDAVEEVIQPIECTEPTKTPEPVPAELPATTRDSFGSLRSTSSEDSGIPTSDDSSSEMISDERPTDLGVTNAEPVATMPPSNTVFIPVFYFPSTYPSSEFNRISQEILSKLPNFLRQ